MYSSGCWQLDRETGNLLKTAYSFILDCECFSLARVWMLGGLRTFSHSMGDRQWQSALGVPQTEPAWKGACKTYRMGTRLASLECTASNCAQLDAVFQKQFAAASSYISQVGTSGTFAHEIMGSLMRISEQLRKAKKKPRTSTKASVVDVHMTHAPQSLWHRSFAVRTCVGPLTERSFRRVLPPKFFVFCFCFFFERSFISFSC